MVPGARLEQTYDDKLAFATSSSTTFCANPRFDRILRPAEIARQT